MSHSHSSRYSSYPARRRGFWSTVFRLAGWCLLVAIVVSGGLWLVGVAAGLVTTLLVLALLAAPFLLVAWLIWLVGIVLFGR